VLTLRLRGVEVYDLPAFYGQLLGRIPAFSVDASWVLQWIRDNRKSAVTANLERLVEAVIATVILLLMAPIMLIVAAAIKLDSKGSVFFLQERLGLHEVPFSVRKFRTMVEDAEASTGPTWAEANDPRVTRVGRFLRKTRLDEVPQLLNILRGEMGFVGCRPIRRHFADQLGAQIPFYSLRFSIRPGLTGWAQVQGDYGGSVEGHIEKFEYELYYLANSSLFMDAFILLKTLQVVLFGRGQ
jgi:lipopolysaccharide/colanic/teichoic acid biosynthesis glycosyltransferase